MTKVLYRFLYASIFLFGLCECQTNHSTESDDDVSINDTLPKLNPAKSHADESDTSGSTENSARLPEEKITSVSEIYKKSRKKASVFVVNTNRDTVIRCKEGTLISIPANSFERLRSQSPVDGTIKLSVNEYYTVSDMLLANLTTSSGNSMIETGGMFFISANAKDNNDSLTLKKGKNISIALPISELKNTEGMQVFNGVHGNEGINWEAKNGTAGFAQRWRAGRNEFSLDNIFKNTRVFPDEGPKKMPVLITANTQPTYTTEIAISIREVIQNSSAIDFTRSAIGYIDTMGVLHGQLTGNSKSQFEFETNYSPSFSENIHVNVAVGFKVKIKTKTTLNLKYYDKLFKMGKGNPDSLVATTITFIPALKKIHYERIKEVYGDAISVSMYQKKIKEIKKRQLAYEKHIKLLEANSLSSMNNAQEYLLLNTRNLGWINCDRFLNSTRRVDYLVKLTEKTNLLIVFNNIKSILSSDSKGIFHNVPLGEKITIVALKTENGKIALAMHETVVTDKPFENLQFKLISLSEYKSQLQKLNSI